MEIFRKFKDMFLGTIGMIFFAAVALFILGLIIVAIGDAVGGETYHVDSVLGRYFYTSKENCQYHKRGDPKLVNNGIEVELLSDEPGDDGTCVKIRTKEGDYKDEEGWMRYYRLRKE